MDNHGIIPAFDEMQIDDSSDDYSSDIDSSDIDDEAETETDSDIEFDDDDTSSETESDSMSTASTSVEATESSEDEDESSEDEDESSEDSSIPTNAESTNPDSETDDDITTSPPRGGNRKRKQSQPLWLRNVRKYQSTTDLLLPEVEYKALVQEVLQDLMFKDNKDDDKTITNKAVEALQVASEDYLVDIFTKAQTLAVHRGSDEIGLRDMQLAETFLGYRVDYTF